MCVCSSANVVVVWLTRGRTWILYAWLCRPVACGCDTLPDLDSAPVLQEIRHRIIHEERTCERCLQSYPYPSARCKVQLDGWHALLEGSFCCWFTIKIVPNSIVRHSDMNVDTTHTHMWHYIRHCASCSARQRYKRVMCCSITDESTQCDIFYGQYQNVVT